MTADMTVDGKFYLTHDDEVSTRCGDSYRVRAWMAKNSEHCDAVALIEPISGSSSPECHSVVLGNFIFRRHFQYRLARYRIYERSIRNGFSRLFRVTFDMGGTHHRPILMTAHHVAAEKADILRVIGASAQEVFYEARGAS